MVTEKEVETQIAKIKDLKKILTEAEALLTKMNQKRQEIEVSAGLFESNIYFITKHTPVVSINEFKKIRTSQISTAKQLKELLFEIEKLQLAIASHKKNIEREKELLVKMEHSVKNKVIPFRRDIGQKHRGN